MAPLPLKVSLALKKSTEAAQQQTLLGTIGQSLQTVLTSSNPEGQCQRHRSATPTTCNHRQSAALKGRSMEGSTLPSDLAPQ